MTAPRERVAAAYAQIAAVDRPEVWIALRPEADVLAEADAIDPRLPLAGRTLAVKDNIDVAGLPTTAGCPAYSYDPVVDAPAVARLRAAGALVLGKTNLDQFATGLVGTRSPHGAVRDARRPEYVSGGSSSGSAVAVALGIADLALGTDTAGSGRVPAAFQGIVGVKPTRGLVPATGVVPASRTLDCVSLFARDVRAARRGLWSMAGVDPADPRSRAWPSTAALAAPPVARVAVPLPGQLASDLTADALRAFDAVVDRLDSVELVEVDISPLLAAARLLYDGAFVAERHAAVGDWIAAHPDAADPVVAAIITAAGRPSASALARDVAALDALRLVAAEALGGDALLLPTVPFQPSLAQVAADPVGVNRALGTYTNFANLLDLCAIALPAGAADGGCFGVTLLGPAFGDLIVADLAARIAGEGPACPCSGANEPRGVPVLVVGAHRAGQPLNHELTDRGARPLGLAQTAPSYRLLALDTAPPKPGLVRVERGGVAIEGELWELPGAELGPFLAGLPAPMALGRVALADGREVVGFTCEAVAIDGAQDISEHRSWVAFLDRTAGGFDL